MTTISDERLQRMIHDAIDEGESDNLVSALTELQSLRAQGGVRVSAERLLAHWDKNSGPEKRCEFEGVEYWSPAGRMVDTQFVADLRASLEASPAPVSDAARDVLAERERQKAVEGWTPEHDDAHADGALAEAAAGYAEKACGRNGDPRNPPRNWPWDLKWWKPGNPRRMLVKAGALIISEIERLDRAALAAKGGQ